MANRQLNLEFKRVLCGKHGEPFRAQWPSGFPVFVLEAGKLILADKQFHEEVDGDLANVEAALDKQPICCRLTPERLFELFKDVHCQLNAKRDASPWKIARCENCRIKKLGSPYSYRTVSGLMEHKHLCFRCVIFALQVDTRLNPRDMPQA